MNKYFALRKANRMRTKLLNEKSQEQLKEVIRYLRRVSWDFCGIELVCSDLLDISIQANAENQELFDSISDAKTFVEEVKPCLKTLRAADYFWFVAPLYFFFGWGVGASGSSSSETVMFSPAPSRLIVMSGRSMMTAPFSMRRS